MSRINGFVGRRNLLKLLGVGSAGIAATAAGSVLLSEDKAVAQQQSTPVQKPQPVSPDAAIKRLVEGNQRFVEGKRLNPNQSRLRLQETAVGQYPFAAILGCSDSRVPAEIVFDQGLGDLFVVRIAGNIAALEAIGSLEFATAVLGAQTIVVLGHARCGAVSAAIKGDPLPGRIGIFVEDIKPAVESIRKKTGNIQENAIIANVQYQVARLTESSTILANLIKEGKLKIVGGHYDLAKGKITLLT
ncbi:MAG: carbonic anhydrase [Spirirestis rafaelensis WJT71-NPBG6]|jgi:carbonic anhydrase|nr:carbonic anhydrase [Spirirestis rafaelensis WJT71-NPBG6]